MKKFFSIFNISITQEFAYRLNFIMWRVRNVLTILLVFFLWDSVFLGGERVLFGYDRASIMTYILGVVFVKAFVLSARAVDVSGEIANGDIINLLLKPINYFKYWLTRDIASKVLNLMFATVEILLLYFFFRPEFFLQSNPVLIAAFVLSILLAMFIFFNLLFIISSVSFWTPEFSWGAQFLIIVVITEFLSGSMFPIDVFPESISRILNLTPFPYLIFFPIQVYLGKISQSELLFGLSISAFWAVALYFFMKFIWGIGLKNYQAYGR